jgi:hypothetical protein
MVKRLCFRCGFTLSSTYGEAHPESSVEINYGQTCIKVNDICSSCARDLALALLTNPPAEGDES